MNFLSFAVLVCIAFISKVASDGVQFSRTVNSLASDATFVVKFDNGCASTDAYGSNDCSWAWNTQIFGSVDASFASPLETGSKLAVNMKVDKVINWSFTCDACGSDCSTTIPVVNEPYTFSMPPCPISPAGVIEMFNSTLPATSATNGIKVSAVGTIAITDQTGASVINLGIDLTVQ